MIMQMIERFPDLTVKGNDDETILQIMCQRPELCEVAETIIQRSGVDINAKARSGATCLILAATNNCFDTVRMLVNHSADVEAADGEADTALNAAIAKGNKEIASFLIENGSPLNPKQQSLKKWKAMLEHNRRVRQALSPPRATKQPSTRLPRAQPSPIVARNQSSRVSMSPSEIQTLHALVSKLATQNGEPSINHPASPKFGAVPGHSAPAPSFLAGHNPNTFALNAQIPSGYGSVYDEIGFGSSSNYGMEYWDPTLQDTDYFAQNLGQ